MRRASALVPILASLFAASAAVQAQGYASSPEWRAEKCRRYGAAWDRIQNGRGTRDLSAEFLNRHAAFLASGCTSPADVCPRGKAELDVANLLVMMAMGEGMASTFLPFSCKENRP